MRKTLADFRTLATPPLFGWLQNPPIEIEVYFNRFVLKAKGCEFELEANPPFSNSRLIVADFEAGVLNAKTLVELVPNKWYLGQPVALINVKEPLADGFTLIERKILLEMFLQVKTRPVIFYQDKLVEVPKV